MADLTHLDDSGAARMVDVAAKPDTQRRAVATGRIAMSAEAATAIRDGSVAKGDVLAVARVAGIMAAKRTGDLIPLCHPLPITSAAIDLAADDAGVTVTATVTTTGKTGVEMEAMTAVSIALLTIYDMAKAIDKGMTIGSVRLLEKRGGKSGVWAAAGGKTMSDLKLFRLDHDGIRELAQQAPQVEKSLQALFEANLEGILGVRFLATEFSTGPVHGGRMDTLGIDEDGSPVIIEYKRSINENVINQGLFYLDWLMDHKKDFQWLVMEKLGKDIAATVEWSAPRLICIAGDFTRYDEHAVKQIARNIELIRYRRFADDLLLIDLVHAPRTASRAPATIEAGAGDKPVAGNAKDPYLSQRIDYRLSNASAPLRDVWDSVVANLTALGDDIQVKELKFYVAFKRIKNFVCLEIYPTVGSVVAYTKLEPDSVEIEPGFTRDVRQIGHFGTGDLEVVMRSADDVARALPLFQRAYDRG